MCSTKQELGGGVTRQDGCSVVGTGNAPDPPSL